MLGDELDSPRGRIYLIKDMLEGQKTPTPKVVKHLDRCLSCLSCQSICPSNVTYMHLIDHARTYIEENYDRPALDRRLRNMLAWLFVQPKMFAWMLRGARLARPFAALAPGRLAAMMRSAPKPVPATSPTKFAVIPAEGEKRAWVAMLQGCAQQAVGGDVNAATIRLLTRQGCDVVLLPEAFCCGSITHHLGQKEPTLARVKGNIAAWTSELNGDGLDAIVINASGCGTQVKDYGFLLREDDEWAAQAEAVSGLAKDVSEFLHALGMRNVDAVEVEGVKVTYQSPCSLQHGQGIILEPVNLLRAAGFEVSEPKEPHMCCGSAGTYSLLQPEIAGQLRDRKVEKLQDTSPDVIASGNVGCMTQLRGGIDVPIVHTVELLDWATGGPKPGELL